MRSALFSKGKIILFTAVLVFLEIKKLMIPSCNQNIQFILLTNLFEFKTVLITPGDGF